MGYTCATKVNTKRGYNTLSILLVDIIIICMKQQICKILPQYGLFSETWKYEGGITSNRI